MLAASNKQQFPSGAVGQSGASGAKRHALFQELTQNLLLCFGAKQQLGHGCQFSSNCAGAHLLLGHDTALAQIKTIRTTLLWTDQFFARNQTTEQMCQLVEGLAFPVVRIDCPSIGWGDLNDNPLLGLEHLQCHNKCCNSA